MTTDTGHEPAAQQAVTELLALAEVTRPDVDTSRLNGAIIAAQNAGWGWPRILTAVAGMLARGEEPRDLLNAIEADPVRRYVRKDHQ
jgi:hypothetical protein